MSVLMLWLFFALGFIAGGGVMTLLLYMPLVRKRKDKTI